MGNQKIVAIIIAVIAAVLVVVAGKSCSSEKSSEDSHSAAEYNTPLKVIVSVDGGYGKNDDVVTASPDKNKPEVLTTEENTFISVEYITDLLGRVVSTVTYQMTVETTTEQSTHIEYITDLLGRVKETVIVSGPEPVTEPTTQKAVHGGF